MTAILRGETSERPGGISLNGSTYRRRFSVKTTSIYDGPHQVVRCEGLPQFLSSYQTPNESDANAFLIDVQAVPRESPNEWFVDCDYGPIESTDLIGGDSNPLNMPIEFSGSLAQRTKLTTKDITGKARKNSAGDPYAAQERDDSCPELEITRNEAGFSLLTIANYKDKLNSDQFLGIFAPGTLKMQHIGFRRQVQGGIVFTQVTYHILYSETWKTELLDEGFYSNVAGVRERIFIPDANGARLILPSEPQLLDGNGGVLQQGDEPVYRMFDEYYSRPFNPIVS